MTSIAIGLLSRPFARARNAEKLRALRRPIDQAGLERIGGIDQWTHVRGSHPASPLLLIVHGGPGAPHSPFASWLTAWEEHFTLVQWDQRGAGRTLAHNRWDGCLPLSVDRLVEDGLELVERLLARHGHRKLVLLGSSVGSTIGACMAARRPGLFHAYVGVNQNGPTTLRDSHRLTRAALERSGSKRGIAVLERMGGDPTRWRQEDLRALNELSIRVSTDVPDMVADIMLPGLLFAPDLTMADIRGIDRGMNASMAQLFPELVSIDLREHAPVIDVPFIVLQGVGDIITPVESARAYLEQVRAPHKELRLIPGAGHLAELARPDVALRELVAHVLPFCGEAAT